MVADVGDLEGHILREMADPRHSGSTEGSHGVRLQ